MIAVQCPWPSSLIDTGYPGHYRSVVESIEAIGQPLAAVKAILLTHAHIDHLGCAQRLAAELDIAVYAHADELAHADRCHGNTGVSGTCDHWAVDAMYQIIDMSGNGERIDRQWLCPDEHRDIHVEGAYPHFGGVLMTILVQEALKPLGLRSYSKSQRQARLERLDQIVNRGVFDALRRPPARP